MVHGSIIIHVQREEKMDADVETIVDLMESELGASSKKQDTSARAKFNIFK